MAEEKKGPAGEAPKRKLPKGRHVSAIKRHRQSLKREAQNRPVKSVLHSAIKNVVKAVSQKDAALAQSALRKAVSLLHRAANKGLIHDRNASRHIARLSALVANSSSPT